MTKNYFASMQNSKLAEHARTAICHDAVPGVTVERLKESDYWTPILRLLARGSLIHVINEAEGFFAEILVREIGTAYAGVTMLRVVKLPTVHPADDEVGLPENHSVTFLGPAGKWACMRGDQILQQDFDSKGDALRYMADLARAGAMS